jgi:hypothetical protein
MVQICIAMQICTARATAPKKGAARVLQGGSLLGFRMAEDGLVVQIFA